MPAEAPSFRQTRHLLALGYAEGDNLLWNAAQNSIYHNKPATQAEASLHWLINDALTGFGARELREVMLGFNGQAPERIYVPTVNITAPKHDKARDRVMGPDGRQAEHRLTLPLPITFISYELFAAGSRNSTRLIEEYNADPVFIAVNEREDLTRMVARRMSLRNRYFPGRNWDYGPVNNWLLAEDAVLEAFSGPSYALPPVQ
ncbi:MAG TPA: hypothetical protein VJG66_03985 [Patescibacteria group bacterium]|nr:hypothetical protein [Patescibacteria group bacterium]